MPFALPKCGTRASAVKSPFGTPTKWRSDCLPTRRDVGAYYMLMRKEMESKGGRVPSTRDVAKKVR